MPVDHLTLFLLLVLNPDGTMTPTNLFVSERADCAPLMDEYHAVVDPHADLLCKEGTFRLKQQ